MDRVNRVFRSYVRVRDAVRLKRDQVMFPYFNVGVPLSRRMLYIMGPSIVLGGSMELFMIHTGFYSVVTRKEAERRLEQEDPVWEKHRRERRLKLAEEERQKAEEKAAADALRAAKRQLLQPPPQKPAQ